jgi:hypothetical protein
LWRIDTKHRKVTIDAASPGDEASIVAVVAFNDDQLEELRQSLREYVEIEVSIVEERRTYEQTARSRIMKLLSVKPWSPVDDAYAAEADIDADTSAASADEG